MPIPIVMNEPQAIVLDTSGIVFVLTKIPQDIFSPKLLVSYLLDAQMQEEQIGKTFINNPHRTILLSHVFVLCGEYVDQLDNEEDIKKYCITPGIIEKIEIAMLNYNLEIVFTQGDVND